jgi:antagonist of KipI
MLEVLEAGPLTTVQGGGRFRVSHLGISSGGAADPVSWEIGNRLVSNVAGEAGLEMTLRGGSFRFREGAVFALTGADCSALLDDKPAPGWQSVEARAGQILKLGNCRGGARAYLSVRGGILEPRVGEKIRVGEVLEVGESQGPMKPTRTSYRLTLGTEVVLRALEGLDWELFPAPLRSVFRESSFEVSPYSNRNGIRLKGALPSGNGPGERITEGVLWGTLQLPPSGEPLILMNDQQTTGGYPRLAQVIQADRCVLGQLKPGQKVSFQFVEFEAAEDLLREQARLVALCGT